MNVRCEKTDEVSEIGEWLTGEFWGLLPSSVINRVLNASRRDLEGRIAAEEFGEMLHALSRFRLRRMLAEEKQGKIRIPRSR